MKSSLQYLLAIFMGGCLISSGPSFAQDDQRDVTLRWSALPPIPDALGVAAPFVGVSDGHLIVAGGANFPGGPPWEGHAKVWHDEIYGLSSPTGTWKLLGRLPHPLGYGLGGTWKNSLICIGGSDSRSHHAECFQLFLKDGKIHFEKLPPLPEPRAMAAGALIGDVFYVAGGQSHPDSKRAESTFWALDLSAKERRWSELATWPGPPRILAVAGTLDGCFYLLSGAELVAGPEGTVGRKFLKDASRYHPRQGWTRMADLPHSVAAAPSPSPSISSHELLVIGGDDGTNFLRNAVLRDRHPGFSRSILSFDLRRNSWTIRGTFPDSVPFIHTKQKEKTADVVDPVFPPVTTMTTFWNNCIILSSGEVRPGIRTSNVLMLNGK